MTPREMALALAKAIDEFDPEDAAEACDLNNEPPYCLDCNGQYRMETGDDPTALCDACAHKNLTEFAKALLAANAECERMTKHVAHNDEEYLVMEDVLRAEHEECKRLRVELERLRGVYVAATNVDRAYSIGLGFHPGLREDIKATRFGRSLDKLTAQIHKARTALDAARGGGE